VQVSAQTYGHEWIKPNNSYYKFVINKDNIYRITKAKLDELGFGNVPGSNFAIFREGSEVPIYVTTNGVLGTNDYIEFAGFKANGLMDTALFVDPSHKLNLRRNIINDNAYYFLTHDNSAHKRLTLTNNPIPANAVVPTHYYKETYISQPPLQGFVGPSISNSENYTSSIFKKGAGLAYSATWQNTNVSHTIYHYNPYNLLPAKVELKIFNTSTSSTNSVKITFGNETIIDTIIGPNILLKLEKKLITNLIASISALNFVQNGKIILIDVKLDYPSTPNYSFNTSYEIFKLKKENNLLQINNIWTPAGKNPIVKAIDLNSNNLHIGAINQSTRVVQVLLNSSFEDRNIITCVDWSIAEITTFTRFTPSNFHNINGNYIILTNNQLKSATPNYISQYENYRKSTAGGNYNAVTVSVEDIYNFFGYGYEFHPLGIKRFIKYALDNWNIKPEYLFIIGKGMNYSVYNTYLNNIANYVATPIPTWGYPGTDNLFSSFSSNGKNMPELATGRLSVITNDEIGIYLEKVKNYELAIEPKDNIEESLWKKRVLHVAGASDQVLQNSLLSTLNNAKTIISDSNINADVSTIFKTSTDPISSVTDQRIDSLINSGLRYITFYGHAASAGFDYNLNAPDAQNSKPKYHIFQAYGCDVAGIFNASELRTISEKYMLSANGGSIAMIASNNLGWTNVIPSYMLNMYKELSYKNYESTLGKQYLSNIKYLNTTFSNNEYFDIHTQSFLLQGDPGLLLKTPKLPDFAIENKYISTFPATITSALPSFKVNAKIYNIGKSAKDSVWIKIRQVQTSTFNSGYVDSVMVKINLNDSIKFEVPLFANKSLGLNKYEIEIDPQNQHDELFKTNNKATFEIYINSEDLVPIYPYNYAIVNKNDITLKASTLNSFSTIKKYLIEIDTTKEFNSTLKQSKNFTSVGGVISWKPTINYFDSVVYYWRTASDSLINGEIKWNNSSFVYIANGETGWNQSHYFQYLEDSLAGISLPNRKFEFTPIEYSYSSYNLPVISSQNLREFEDIFNGNLLNSGSCIVGRSIQIGIFDSISSLPLTNTHGCNSTTLISMNHFSINTLAQRNIARDYIQNIPNGQYVTIKNMVYTPNTTLPIHNPRNWIEDTLSNNSNNTLYHTLIDLGFTDIENLSISGHPRFIFFTKKGDISYTPKQVISQANEKIALNLTLISKPDTGTLISTIIGPSKKWESLHWKQLATDLYPQYDSSFVKIIGIAPNNLEAILYEGYSKDTLLNFVDANQYPNIKLIWNSVDNVNRSSANLEYWRVHYTPVPEAALNKAKLFSYKDSIGFGVPLNIKLAIENISDSDMDSMLVRFRLIDQNNVTHDLGNKRFRALPAGDTLVADFSTDLRNHTGNNTLFVEANPNNDQQEQYHPNNIGYLPLNIAVDNRNPLLDVTFDGVRILDKDLVSAKPFVKILLNDENKNLLLNDTALFEVMLTHPGNNANAVRVPIDGNICKFFPALPGQNKNEAYVEYRPSLEEDGLYKLEVRARDRNANKAGNFDSYQVNFMVENKSTITNLLNYPNPFSSSTAFVFTLTGSQIPSQFKIQIISVTGKVVREITKEELGPLHIGRNITEYKWDGKDQYGQMLGNGVYLYRVITHTNGENIEHRANTNIDKYFKNGYGKMYIMR